MSSLWGLPPALAQHALVPLLDAPSALALACACGVRAGTGTGAWSGGEEQEQHSGGSSNNTIATPNKPEGDGAAAAPAGPTTGTGTGTGTAPAATAPPSAAAPASTAAAALSSFRDSLCDWMAFASHRRVDASLRAHLLLLERTFGVVRIASAKEEQERRAAEEAARPPDPYIYGPTVWTPELLAAVRAIQPDFDPHAPDDGDDDRDDDDEVDPLPPPPPPPEARQSASESGVPVAPRVLAAEAWAAKGATSEPLGLNLLHLWARCVWWQIPDKIVPIDDEEETDGREESSSEEVRDREWSLASDPLARGGTYDRVFLPCWWSQLTCGLLLPAALHRALQQAPSSLVHAKSQSAPVRTNPLQRLFFRQLQLLLQRSAAPSVPRPHLVLHLELALSRLLPASGALVAVNAQWALHGPGFRERASGQQITPFVLPWPSTHQEARRLVAAVRANNIREDDHELIEARSHLKCSTCEAHEPEGGGGGASNSAEAEASASVSSSSFDPGPRRDIDRLLRHTQIVRGCVWWRCELGAAWLGHLLLSQAGVAQACLIDAYDQPSIIGAVEGHRDVGAWPPFFGVSSASPPSRLLEPVLVAPAEPLRPLDPSGRAAALLSAALPWSFGVVMHAFSFNPQPSFLVAPLAPGLVGGFAGSAHMGSE